MNVKNLSVLENMFNWLMLEELSNDQFNLISKKLNYPLENNFYFKCTWSYYKKCTFFSLNNTPLLFLKYVRDNFFFELFGIHLTSKIFDYQLGFSNYVGGLLGKKKKAIPYILTTYERGESIKHHNINDYKFALGKLCYLHELLCLYDVYDRHLLIKNKNTICRIDFGRSFENLHKKYLGFSDYLKSKKLDYNDVEFQKGYFIEKRVILNNVISRKEEFIQFIRNIKNLKIDYELIHFEPDKFHEQLIHYWYRIGFLKDVGISLDTFK